MSNQNQKLSKCTACSAEIAKNAKACPQCGSNIKKPFYKKWWFIAVVVVVVIAAVAGAGGGGEDVPVSQTQEQQKEIVYTAYDVSKLMDDLETNALNAENTYGNQYVMLTGRLGNIDSDGAYITLLPADDDFAFLGVQCYIKNDEQKAKVAQMSKDDIVTVKGKIKSVGELLGYSLDIDSIE